MGDVVGERCSAGIGGTGGVNAFINAGGVYVEEEGREYIAASVLDRSRTLFWPSIFPRNALVFALTEVLGALIK